MLEVLKDSFAVAFKKPLTYVALIAVPLLVALFGLLYPGTFIDPYEEMKNLPIAVVNEDAGCVVDGEEQHFGDDIVSSIMENDSAKWTEESPELLENGIENTDYYLAIVIPEDFSERVAAGQTGNPEQANLTFIKNVRRNYMLSTMSTKIETALHETLNGQISSQYSKALAEGLVSAKDGFNDAADGADSLTEGLGTASDGAAQLNDGLASLSSGTATLSQGLDTLNSSSSNLVEGSSKVKDGIAQLAAGSDTYQSSLSAAQSKVSASFGGNPANSVDSAKAQYAQALRAYTAAVAQAAATGGDVTSVDSSKVNAAVEALAQTAQAAGTYGALAQASSGYEQLDAGISSLQASYGSLDSGIAQYTDAVGALAEGGQSASAGASALQQGSQSLVEGLNSAQDGSQELSDGLSDGAQTIEDSLTVSPDEMSDYLSDPAQVNEDNYGDLDKFGYGFAPLFMTMCLWLGALIIFFLFEPFPSRELQEKTGRAAAIFGRWPAYLMVSVLEAAAVCIGACLLGISFQDLPTAVLLYACLAFSFMCIMQFFNLFDILGKAMSVFLLIVQLVCCSGTLPAQLGNDFAVAVGPWLPFYYGIDAFREIMSGTQLSVVYSDMGMLLLFAAGAVVLSLLSYPLALKMKRKRAGQSFHDLALGIGGPHYA